MDKLERAKKRVKAKKDFYSHLSTYLTMTAFFFILNMLTSRGNWWFYWPMLGWGIGLVIHYFNTFGLPGTDAMSSEWEDRMLRKELRNLEHEPTEDADHLELREIQKEKGPSKKWKEDDLV